MASALPPDPLDLPPYAGQHLATFQFTLIDGPTGVHRGSLTPLRTPTPTISHDTTATISRRVTGLTLAANDAARLQPLTDRIEIAMALPGRPPYPLGRYVIADTVELTATGTATTKPVTLLDEMLLIDQDLETGFDTGGQLVDQAIRRLLDGLPIRAPLIEATEHTTSTSWPPGTSRGSVLTDLATAGGYLKPWLDHTGRLRLRRAFQPADRAPDIDLDTGPRVLRDSISRSTELLSAPNRFVVVFNDLGPDTTPVIGVYDVPAAAPHSITSRGYVVPQVVDAQVTTARQATVYARTLGIQQTIHEVVELSTPPDPRHDGYDVVRFDGHLWLETGWELPLAPGGPMRHTLRRAYPSTEPGAAA